MAKRSTTWSRKIRQAVVGEILKSKHFDALERSEIVDHHVKKCLSVLENEHTASEHSCPEINGKPCLVYAGPHNKVVDKITAIHIRNTLDLPPANRNKIIRTLTSLLPEFGPSTIHRYDIASFFESVNREQVITQLLSSRELDTISVRAIHKYNATCKDAGIVGLARGTAISSALAEWFLHRLDVRMRQTAGIYFYARFVDDILAIGAGSQSDVNPQDVITEFLNDPNHSMSLNPSKNKLSDISCKRTTNEKSLLSKPFEYLGYKFFCPNNDQRLAIDISQQKLQRIKSRVAKSLIRFLDHKTFALLLSDIQYLSGNTVLIKRGIHSKAMRTGIFYNYPALTEESYRAGGALRDLDNFLRLTLTPGNTNLSRRVASAITSSQRQQLLRCSFVAGHRHRIFTGFSREKARRLVDRWKHD